MCHQGGREYTFEESQQAKKSFGGIATALGGGLFGVVNDVLTLGKGLGPDAALGFDRCPGGSSHVGCPRCGHRQLVGLLQTGSVVICDECGVEYAV